MRGRRKVWLHRNLVHCGFDGRCVVKRTSCLERPSTRWGVGIAKRIESMGAIHGSAVGSTAGSDKVTFDKSH